LVPGLSVLALAGTGTSTGADGTSTCALKQLPMDGSVSYSASREQKEKGDSE
jgi:hypothetical protein